MADVFGCCILTTGRNRTVLSIILASGVIVAAGCGGSDGEPLAGGLGGAAAANGGSFGTGSGGADKGGAGNGGTTAVQTGGNASTVQTGGSTATAQTGGAPGQGGLGTGGSTAQSGGAVATGGVANRGGTTSTGGFNAAGADQSGGNTALGGKATGGVVAAGGVASTGGAKASGGIPAGGSSTGGAKATGGTLATGGAAASGGAAGSLPAVTIYVAGDSTVSTYTDTSATNDQAGWGQMLKTIFNTKVTVVNRAVGGRTAYWFYLEGAVSNILSTIKAGDYFFIQFGTNDQNTTATFTVNGTTYPRYAAADTDFKAQLKQYYLDPTKAKGAIPVLVTPPPRNSAYCNGGNGLSAYATAMIQLGAAENVAVLDNNGKTFNYLKAICPKPTTAAAETFFKVNTDGTIDGTHFQENGARRMAGFIGEEIKRINLGLASYLL